LRVAGNLDRISDSLADGTMRGDLHVVRYREERHVEAPT
jgi:hypothetical protein